MLAKLPGQWERTIAAGGYSLIFLVSDGPDAPAAALRSEPHSLDRKTSHVALLSCARGEGGEEEGKKKRQGSR